MKTKHGNSDRDPSVVRKSFDRLVSERDGLDRSDAWSCIEETAMEQSLTPEAVALLAILGWR